MKVLQSMLTGVNNALVVIGIDTNFPVALRHVYKPSYNFLRLSLITPNRMRSDRSQCPVFRGTSSSHSIAKSDSTTRAESSSSVSPASDRPTTSVSECNQSRDRPSESPGANCPARTAPDCVLIDEQDCEWPFRERRECRLHLALDLVKCSIATELSRFVDRSRCG